VRRTKSSGGNSLLKPQNDIIAGAVIIISQVVVESQVGHLASLQEFNSLLRPTNLVPPLWGLTLIIQVGFLLISIRFVVDLVRQGLDMLGIRCRTSCLQSHEKFQANVDPTSPTLKGVGFNRRLYEITNQ